MIKSGFLWNNLFIPPKISMIYFIGPYNFWKHLLGILEKN